MAEANLKKYAKKKGYDIKVETQGSMGVENRLKQQEIDDADIIIFAVDTNVSDSDRFEGKKIFKIGTSEVVKDGAIAIDQAVALIKK
jgi:PTS system fructose-specific IIB component/fructose-specific PTS system IIB-like component